jgi:hypothetical protein
MARGKKTGGRVKGTPNQVTERRRRLIEAIDADDKAIVDRVIAGAKVGEPEAIRTYFRYLRPPPRSEMFLDPTDYMTPETSEEAREAILKLSQRLAEGEISLEMHDALVNDLRAYLGDRAAEQQRKLDELEEALRGKAAT